MKKYGLAVVTLLIVVIGVLFTGCNKDLLDTNYTYDRAVMLIGGEVVEVQVKQWRDYEDGEQIQVISTDGKTYLVNSVNCTLIND